MNEFKANSNIRALMEGIQWLFATAACRAIGGGAVSEG
jgi:hypothetical protein